MEPAGQCVMGGGPLPQDYTRLAMVPRCASHRECFEKDPGAWMAASQMVPCCEARASVETLRGCVIMRDPGIGDNEVGIYDPENKVIHLYEIGFDGRLHFKEPPPPPTRPLTQEEKDGVELPPPPPPRRIEQEEPPEVPEKF